MPATREIADWASSLSYDDIPSRLHAKTKAQIAAKRKALVSGKFNVFQGPIYDQSGKLKVKPGQKLRLIQDLYTMQWLVKGVVGKVSSVLPPG